MPLKREPEAVSSLPLGRIEGETIVSKGCQVGSKPSPGSYSSALLKKPLLLSPPATSTLPEGSSRRRVKSACGGEAAGATPGSRRRIVQFRAAQVTAIESSRDQHLARGQQRRRVCGACGAEAAGRRPTRINDYRIAQPC